MMLLAWAAFVASVSALVQPVATHHLLCLVFQKGSF